MKKLLATLLCLAPISAFAVPISGSISIDGQDSYTASKVNFAGKGNVGVGTASGSFAPAFSAGCFGCVTLTSFNYVGFTSPVTVYSATIGGRTTTFQITSIVSEQQSGAFLDVEAKGFATLTGFDKTPGIYDFSTQGGINKSVTFSATTTATPTPEPVSMAVLGAGLLGVGLFRRKA